MHILTCKIDGEYKEITYLEDETLGEIICEIFEIKSKYLRIENVFKGTYDFSFGTLGLHNFSVFTKEDITSFKPREELGRLFVDFDIKNIRSMENELRGVFKNIMKFTQTRVTDLKIEEVI